MKFVLKEEPSGLGDRQSAEFQDPVGFFSNLIENDLLVWQNDTTC